MEQTIEPEVTPVAEDLLQQPDASVVLKRGLFNRLFGNCLTKPPADGGSWDFRDGKLTLDLVRIPELKERGRAVRIESNLLPKPVLIVHGDDGSFYAFHNHCGHGGRRLDPVPGAGTVQCCSLGHTTYSYEGRNLSGSDAKDIKPFSLKRDGDTLIVQVPE